MAREARAVDYNIESHLTSVASERAEPAHTVPEFLQLLARSIQQFHTYPATSPLCRSAIDAAQRALAQVRRDQVSFRVSPHELIVEEIPVGRGTIIETELARRLHSAGIAQVTVEQAVTARELAHFAVDLLACSHRDRSDVSLGEVLTEHGVDRIALRQAYRPEVLPVSAPAPAVADLIAFQRERREHTFSTGGHAEHLYPPDKGWVRCDPASPLPSVALTDLALLTNDPAALARMLVRLTDDEPSEDETGDALSQKFSDVSLIFSALDPRVARLMFSKLARAVLELDTERRQALLRRTILPSLLDGRIDGTVLRDFPDVDLAESLCLLLDLETAAPEVVTTALARLDLTPDREAAVIPLIERRMEARAAARPEELGLDAHARRLVRVNHDRNRSFAEFAAFDLSLDAEASQTLVQIREQIAATDIVIEQIGCLCRLTRLEPNPDLVDRFLVRTLPLFAALQRAGRWTELSAWLSRYRGLAGSMRETRPDVSAVIDARLAGLCTPEQARTLVDLAGRGDEERGTANRIIAALGADIGPALLGALTLEGDGKEQRARAAMQVLCDHARLVAPALAAALGRVDTSLARIIARVLGLAGPGYETALSSLLDSRDEQTVRDTLRSLARIGTPEAAAIVSAQVEKRRDWVASAAEQTLWHFPPAEAQREVRQLLSRREFLLQHPTVAARLLDRMAHTGISGLEATLRSTVPLQYRFWNPAQRRLGRKARGLLNR